jgi:hypothetical protein
MSVVTQLYFQIVEENNYMFRPFFDDGPPGKGPKHVVVSCFLQQFKNTVVLRRTFIHIIYTSLDYHFYIYSIYIYIYIYLRAWLPSQAPRGGLASQTRTCMGTLKASVACKKGETYYLYRYY